MKYDVQGLAEFYLTTGTDLSEQEFENKFHPDNIVKATLRVVLSDGSERDIDVMECLNLQWCSHLEKENH